MTALNRREMLRLVGAGALAGMTTRARSEETRDAISDQRPPNIVVIFADDLGYSDLSCYGAEKIKTPRLDKMADEGMRLTDFYCNSPVCSPSRAGLLTGRYPIRMGINHVFFPYSEDGLDASEITIAHVLKERGYATACIGKWHLGHLPQFLPTRRGFDYYYGIPYSNDMDVEERGDPPVPLMRNEEIIEQPVDQRTVTKRYTEEAVSFIKEHSDEPFFLYLPHTMPHVPLYVSEEFEGLSEGGLYGDVIEEMDWSTGVILDAIQEAGIDENTLVIFTSDNGPWLVKGEHGGKADPLRHGKGTTFEGGMRVPCIMRWPSVIQAGRVENAPAITLDFLPTFAALAGADVPGDRVIDGSDISGILTGKGKRAHEDIYYFNRDELQAFRSGKWKLKRPFSGRVYGVPEEHPLLLTDLEADPGETSNLADKHPQMVARMSEQMDAFWESLQPIPSTRR